MKTARIAIITLVFAVPGLIRAQDQSTAPTQAKSKAAKWDSLTPMERARKISRIKGSRKIDLKPLKQSDGIKTGCVMAYGHIIPPPYNVQHADNKLVINGIQLLPSLVAQREAKPLKVTDEQRALVNKASELERTIRLMFRKGLDDKDDIQSLQSNILAFAKSNEMVSDAKWSGTLLHIQYKDKWLSGVLIELNKDMPRQDEAGASSTKEITKKVQVDSANQIKRALSRGAFYVFADGLEETHGDILPKVQTVMGEKALTEAERFERLKTIFHSEAALYVIENYVAAEWENSGCVLNPDYPQEWSQKPAQGK